MVRSSVVLPLPDAPSTAVNDRSGTVRLTSFSTCTGPNATRRPSTRSAVPAHVAITAPAGLRRRANQATTTRLGTAAISRIATAYGAAAP